MDRQGAQAIIGTLKEYSAQVKTVLSYLYQYDYRDEANHFKDNILPTVIEPEHPTLHGLYQQLIRFIVTVPERADNISREKQLNRNNIEAFKNYLQVNRDTILAEAFLSIPIEPILTVADIFHDFNLINEARQIKNIYEFAWGIRRWYTASTHHNGIVPIAITLQLNYDEATPEEIDANAGYKIFSDLFRPDTNYTTNQKRALYNSLKDLYSSTTFNVKEADRTVMAAILILRNRSVYKNCLDYHKFVECKKRAFSSFRRDCNVVRPYTENSLTSAPKIAKKHIERAENIILEAFSQTK